MKQINRFLDKRQYACCVLERLKHDIRYFELNHKIDAKLGREVQRNIKEVRAFEVCESLIELLQEVVMIGGMETNKKSLNRRFKLSNSSRLKN